jgi:tetratricopeptide (TPR) repeat protein
VAHAARIEADAQRATAVTQRDAAERIVAYLIGELRNRLDALGKLDLLGGLGGEVEAYYRTVAPSDEVLDTAALERRASALELLSSVEWRRRNVALAATLMRGSLEARTVKSARSPDDLTALVDLALAHASLANLLEQSDAPEFAAEDERAAAVVRVLEARSDLPSTAQIAMAWVRATLAENASTKGRADEARALVTDARKAVALVGDFKTLDGRWQDRLAETEFAIAVVAFRLQDWPLAVESMGASVAIRRSMDQQHPHHAGVLTELATSLRWLGEAHEERYEDRQAIDAHREALVIERALLESDPENLRVAQETAGTLTSLCLLRREWDGPAAADAECLEGRTMAEKLSRSHPHDRQSWNVLARALRASGESALAGRRYADALALFQSAVDASRHALSSAKGNRDMQVDLADCLNDLGRALLALGHADEARARTREALAIKEPLLAAVAEESTLVGVGESSMLLGDTERGDEARADYAHAVDLFAKAHAADGDDLEPALYLAKASGKLAATERDAVARAELLHRAAEAVAPHLAVGRVSPEWRTELAAADPHLVGAQVARLK